MRLALVLVLSALTICAAYAASLPEPNYIDLRVLATYAVILPDGQRVTIDSVSLARGVQSEMRAAQAARAAQAEPTEDQK